VIFVIFLISFFVFSVHITKVGPVYGKLPRGCRLCGKGAKLVLFATGRCPFSCFYCPISEERRGREQAFANERPIVNLEDLMEEALTMRALGAGVTGGEPLASSATFKFVSFLRENLGERFHIHLYTRVTEAKKLEKAYEAGVDEVRFHFVDPSPALDFSWSVGAEIPVIPGWKKALKNYILFLDRLEVEFVNLNELEFSDANFLELEKRGFKRKGELDSGVAGSEELALELLRWAEEEGLGISLHYCSARTKTEVQLVERYRRTARNIARSYERITDEGTIVVGIVGRSKEVIEKLRKIGCRFEIVGDEIRTSPECVLELGKGKIVEYWPTFDRKPVEVTPVG